MVVDVRSDILCQNCHYPNVPGTVCPCQAEGDWFRGGILPRNLSELWTPVIPDDRDVMESVGEWEEIEPPQWEYDPRPWYPEEDAIDLREEGTEDNPIDLR